MFILDVSNTECCVILMHILIIGLIHKIPIATMCGTTFIQGMTVCLYLRDMSVVSII